MKLKYKMKMEDQNYLRCFHYHRVDAIAVGLFVPDCIISPWPAASVPVLTWFMPVYLIMVNTINSFFFSLSKLLFIIFIIFHGGCLCLQDENDNSRINQMFNRNA